MFEKKVISRYSVEVAITNLPAPAKEEELGSPSELSTFGENDDDLHVAPKSVDIRHTIPDTQSEAGDVIEAIDVMSTLPSDKRRLSMRRRSSKVDDLASVHTYGDDFDGKNGRYGDKKQSRASDGGMFSCTMSCS